MLVRAIPCVTCSKQSKREHRSIATEVGSRPTTSGCEVDNNKAMPLVANNNISNIWDNPATRTSIPREQFNRSVARLLLPQAYEQKQKTLPQAAGYWVRGTGPSKRLRRSILHSTGSTKPEEGTPENCQKAERSNHLTVFCFAHAPGRARKALLMGMTAEKSCLNDPHERAKGRCKNF